MKKKFKVLLVILMMSVVSVGSMGFVDNYFEISKNLDIFATLFRELNMYYVDETDPGKLIEEGIEGMLSSLDPYTSFIPESEMEDHRFAITGKYGGIGALIRKRGQKVLIAEPYENYPAHKAGLRAGDILIEVNGTKIEGKNTSQVSKVLKGQAGTTVKLVFEREGEDEPLEVELTRDEIKINPVPYSGMVTDKIGYIKLNSFTSKASSEIKKALVLLKEKHELEGIILDLRSNPGGLLRESVNLVNLFVGKGKIIVSTKGKMTDWDKVHRALNTPVDDQIPMVVLVNSHSASASEIVSGALQDHDRAVVIGQKTFGKGLVQQTLKLTYNSQLKVTTAKYYIPSGRCIQALDYTHRNADGSVGKVPDSLISEFKTMNGRVVYDGGGIDPDVTMERRKAINILGKLVSKMLIFDYSVKYAREHKSIPPAKDFEITDEEYANFVAFLKDKEYKYTTDSEEALEKLKKIAEKEDSFEDAKEEYLALKEKLTHKESEDLEKHKKEIKERLKNEIVTRYYFQKGRIEGALTSDENVKKAIEVLSDKPTYNAILSGAVVSNAKADKNK
ncbi:MAG: PDZ domain-containing protein [Flavobacteriales bacterium]|nr:PDZ domain-containing protein [Flavobacteriales bacterium]